MKTHHLFSLSLPQPRQKVLKFQKARYKENSNSLNNLLISIWNKTWLISNQNPKKVEYLLKWLFIIKKAEDLLCKLCYLSLSCRLLTIVRSFKVKIFLQETFLPTEEEEEKSRIRLSWNRIRTIKQMLGSLNLNSPIIRRTLTTTKKFRVQKKNLMNPELKWESQ